MPAHFHVVHRIATLAFVLGDLYLLGLWFYAIARTGLLFFWILAGAGIVFLVLAVINVALAYDLQGISGITRFQICSFVRNLPHSSAAQSSARRHRTYDACSMDRPFTYPYDFTGIGLTMRWSERLPAVDQG